MEPIIFARANPEDIETLIDYRIQCTIELFGDHSEQSILELRTQLNRYYNKYILDSSTIVIIAKSDGVIAGIGSIVIRSQPGNFINPSGRIAYVTNMYTVPSFRRKGVCSGILHALIHQAHLLGITAFELHSTKTGEYVYQQNGFALQDEPTYRMYINTETDVINKISHYQ